MIKITHLQQEYVANFTMFTHPVFLSPYKPMLRYLLKMFKPCLTIDNLNSIETKDEIMEVVAQFHPRQEQQTRPRSNPVKFRKKMTDNKAPQ